MSFVVTKCPHAVSRGEVTKYMYLLYSNVTDIILYMSRITARRYLTELLLKWR